MPRRKKPKDLSVVMSRLEVPPQIKDALDGIAGQRGMTFTALHSRIVTWFAAQPPLVQAYILGHLPPGVRFDLSKLMLEQLAEQVRGPRK